MISADENTSRIWRGIIPLIAFAVLSAALDVYAGNQLQLHSPLSLAAVSFSLVAAFFVVWSVAQQGAAAAFRPLRASRGDVLAINTSTAVGWMSMLYGLKYLEPAVVNVISLAIGPAMTVLIGPLLRRKGAVLASERSVSFGIALFIGALVWGSFTGWSGVGALDAGDALAGIALTLVCGVASTVNVIYSKRLSDSGHSPQSVMSIRFFLMIAAVWSMVAVSDHPGLGAVFLPALVIAFVGVGLPLYLIQVGIKYTEPITASLLCTLSPLFTVLLQLPDSRLAPSAFTLVCVVGITLLVGVGTVARGRHERRPRTVSADAGPGSGPGKGFVREGEPS